jgi:hypothetical protein
VTFILVSRATRPTPAENLAIFFEDVPAGPPAATSLTPRGV